MHAAGWWTIRVVDQNVIVTSGTQHAVDRLGELLVPCFLRVLGLRLTSIHRHRVPAFQPRNCAIFSALSFRKAAEKCNKKLKRPCKYIRRAMHDARDTHEKE